LALPLSVTHVDAHSDLGLGDAVYIDVITKLLFLPVEDRRPAAAALVNDGNYLALSIACRWLSDLTLVRNEGGEGRPGDLFPYYMESLDADHIQMEAMTREQLDNRMYNREYEVEASEPKIPLKHTSWQAFKGSAPYDVICLARSPDYTPAEADPLFDLILDLFIDEAAFPSREAASG
jgi:hypothetical protein